MMQKLLFLIILISPFAIRAQDKLEQDLRLLARQIQNMRTFQSLVNKASTSLSSKTNNKLAQTTIRLALAYEAKELWDMAIDRALFLIPLVKRESEQEESHLVAALGILDRLKRNLSLQKAKELLIETENLKLTAKNQLAVDFIRLRIAKHFNLREIIERKIKELALSEQMEKKERAILAYYQGLLSPSLFDQADTLAKALNLSPENSQIRPIVAYELARVEFKLKRYNLAADHLEAIHSKDTSFYLPKLILSIQLALESGHFNQAYEKSLELLKANDSAPESYFIRKISPYLALLAKKPDQARKEASKNIEDISRILVEVESLTTADFAQLSEIEKRLTKFQIQTSTLKKAKSASILYKQAQAKLSVISAQENKWRDFVARTSVEGMSGLSQYDDEIRAKAIASLTLMYKIVDRQVSQQSFSEKDASKHASLKLNRYQRGYTDQKEKPEDIQRVRLAYLNNALANSFQKWQETNTKALSLKHFFSVKLDAQSISKMAPLIRSLKEAQIKREDVLSQFRSYEIAKKIELAAQNNSLNFMRKLNQALTFEDLLVRHEKDSSLFLQKDQMESYDKLWNLYEQMAHELEQISLTLGKMKEKTLHKITAKLKAIHLRKAEVEARLASIDQDANKLIEETMADLHRSYSKLLAEDIAEQKKWLADANWLEYNSLEETGSTVDGQFRLQEQQLLDLKNFLIKKMDPP